MHQRIKKQKKKIALKEKSSNQNQKKKSTTKSDDIIGETRHDKTYMDSKRKMTQTQ